MMTQNKVCPPSQSQAILRPPEWILPGGESSREGVVREVS